MVSLYYFTKSAPIGYGRRIFIRDWKRFDKNHSPSIFTKSELEKLRQVSVFLKEISLWGGEDKVHETEDGPDWVGFEFPSKDYEYPRKDFCFQELMTRVQSILGEDRERVFL
jgi:hypothetical protein